MANRTHNSLAKRIQASVNRVGRDTAIQGVLADLNKIRIRLEYLAKSDEPNYSRLTKAYESVDYAISELIDT